MKIFRLLARRSMRIGLIIALVGSAFAFGHFMTPRTPDAFARVVLEGVGSAMEGMPEYMKTAPPREGEVEQVYLNGNTLYYTLHRTEKDIDTLLDYYENLYRSKDRQVAPEEAKDWVLKQVKDPKERDETKWRIEETERTLNQRYVRFQDKNWGGFATMVTGKEADMDYTADMVKRLAQYKDTGEITELGDPKVVVAFRDPSQDNTQYFNVWPEEGFNVRSMRPQGEEDAPGYDVEDIERPWGSKRQVTFGQDNGGLGYEILVYRGQGNLSSVQDHFFTTMQEDGWAISLRMEEGKERMDDPEPAMLFSKDSREAYVALKKHDDSHDITSTIVVYHRG